MLRWCVIESYYLGLTWNLRELKTNKKKSNKVFG